MVWSFNFFFAFINNIHKKYGKFFEADDEGETNNSEGDEDTPKLDDSEAAARFYFELTYYLSKEDITKFDRLNASNMYLCLNAASLMKDKIIQQQNELKKLERKNKLQ